MELRKLAALLLFAGVVSSASGLIVKNYERPLSMEQMTIEAKWRELARKTVEKGILKLTKVLTPFIGGGGANFAGSPGGLGDNVGKILGGIGGGLGGGLGGALGGALGGGVGGGLFGDDTAQSPVRNIQIGDGTDLALDNHEGNSHAGGELTRQRRRAGVFDELLHELQELQALAFADDQHNTSGEQAEQSTEPSVPTSTTPPSSSFSSTKSTKTTTESSTTTTTHATPENVHNSSSRQRGLWLSACLICLLCSTLRRFI